MASSRGWGWGGVTMLAALVTLVGWASPLRAESKQITVQEQLNQTWGPELVSFAFTAEPGQCVAESIRLQGPAGPVAAQLSDIEYWPGEGRFVKSGRLWCVVDALTPLQSIQYAIEFAAVASSPPPTDLKVREQQGSVELSTSRVAVRLLAGDGGSQGGASLADAPGPLLAMKLGDGAWAGGSSLTGPSQVVRWSSQLIASGPVFATVRSEYSLASGNTVVVLATLVAGDSSVRWEMQVSKDEPELAMQMQLGPVPGVKQALMPKGYGQWARDRKLELKPGSEPFARLSPDSSVVNIFAEHPPTIVLAAEGGPQLQLRSRDAGAWAEEIKPLTYAGFETWNIDMIPLTWEVWKRKTLPVSYAADGMVSLQATLASGGRKWWTSAGDPVVGDQLERVNQMVLEWESPADRRHPWVMVNQQEIEAVWQKAASDPEVMREVKSSEATWAGAALKVLMKPAEQRTENEVAAVVKMLDQELGKLGQFDLMRGGIRTATMYDAMVDSGLLTSEQRKVARAQMAYLGYLMADPQCWSMERGYMSGNPNMSVSYTLTLGIIACALSDHPAAQTWADRATAWMNKWLSDEVGANGEWLPEGSHYGVVSVEPLLAYAIAARNAGYHDFSNDPRLKKLLRYFGQIHTPPDPQRGNLRVTPAFGRGTSGDRLGLSGLAARFYAQVDPVFSSHQQWLWSQIGYRAYVGDYRLGGYEAYYSDRSLPMQKPAWESKLYPQLGAIFRHGFDTPSESFAVVIAGAHSKRNLDIWTPGIGGISQWYGRGVPLSTCFTFGTGYNERHELLRDGVRLARNWGSQGDSLIPFGHYTDTHLAGFAGLPPLDYVRTTIVNTQVDDRDWPPANVPAYPKVTPATSGELSWTRQVMLVKDASATGPAYLVVRDTTQGGQPTAWQFWTLSEKLVTADQARDVETALADKPGQAIQPARELPTSDRYTALGQMGMDVEYYVASPTKTPRHTLRYGGTYRNVPEYQDLLHLQLPGDGTYYVAIYPRRREEKAPVFGTLADGRIIKTAGEWGSDYALLATQETTAAAERVAFRGTAATVQERSGSAALALGAAGEVRWKEYGLIASMPAALQVNADSLVLQLNEAHGGSEVDVIAPEGWSLQEGGQATMQRQGEGYRISVPVGQTQVVLTRGS